MPDHRSALLALAFGLAALSAAAVQAQPRDSLTLYELPDYRGASVTFYGDHANIGSTGFTGKAQSAQVIGAWSVCTGGGYRGRCEQLTRNVRDLSAYGLSRQVGSARRAAAPAERPVAPPVPAPAVPPSAAPVTGVSATFFPYPTLGGLEVSALRFDAADRFCRAQGLGEAVYFDASRTAERSAGADGRVAGPGPVLRDVLCRRY